MISFMDMIDFPRVFNFFALVTLVAMSSLGACMVLLRFFNIKEVGLCSPVGMRFWKDIASVVEVWVVTQGLWGRFYVSWGFYFF